MGLPARLFFFCIALLRGRLSCLGGTHGFVELGEKSMAFIEALEARELLAAVPENINLSRMNGSQSEGAIAVDPTNASRIFVVSNIDRGDGLFTARSSNGGETWSK